MPLLNKFLASLHNDTRPMSSQHGDEVQPAVTANRESLVQHSQIRELALMPESRFVLWKSYVFCL